MGACRAPRGSTRAMGGCARHGGMHVPCRYGVSCASRLFFFFGHSSVTHRIYFEITENNWDSSVICEKTVLILLRDKWSTCLSEKENLASRRRPKTSGDVIVVVQEKRWKRSSRLFLRWKKCICWSCKSFYVLISCAGQRPNVDITSKPVDANKGGCC